VLLLLITVAPAYVMAGDHDGDRDRDHSPVVPVSHDMRRLGHADLQGRTAYQPTLHTINGRVYLFVGHFAGTTPTGLVNGGTTIVDVTDPDDPKQVTFIPSKWVADGSRL